MMRGMKHIVPFAVAALVLSSCSLMPVSTISRTELLTPSTMSVVSPSTYTNMMYYGSDDTYDYFTRNSLKYRVYRTENAMPEAGRFTFDNWNTGKLYAQAAASGGLQSLLSKYRNAR